MGYTGTTNYGFQKPAKENAFTVNDLNNALDKIDETIKARDDAQNSKNTKQDTAIAGNDIDTILVDLDSTDKLKVELIKGDGSKISDSVTLPNAIDTEEYGQKVSGENPIISTTFTLSKSFSIYEYTSDRYDHNDQVARITEYTESQSSDKLCFDTVNNILKRVKTYSYAIQYARKTYKRYGAQQSNTTPFSDEFHSKLKEWLVGTKVMNTNDFLLELSDQNNHTAVIRIHPTISNSIITDLTTAIIGEPFSVDMWAWTMSGVNLSASAGTPITASWAQSGTMNNRPNNETVATSVPSTYKDVTSLS